MSEPPDQADASQAPTATATAPIPHDTDDTRGRHLRELLKTTWVRAGAAGVAFVAFVIATIAAGVLVGLLAAVGALLLAGVVAFAIASSRAKEDFFKAYAAGRGLSRHGKGPLPRTTPLLRKGDKRYAEQIMRGALPGGFAGTLCLYTYEETTRDSKGRSRTEYHRFTVVAHDLDDLAYEVQKLHCEQRSGFRWMDSAEDIFRRMERLELESEAFDKRYEIFYGVDDDEIWMKRLFSPSFIVWLSDHAPKTFAFELFDGGLVVCVDGHHDSAAELDQLCAAAARVAGRLKGAEGP